MRPVDSNDLYSVLLDDDSNEDLRAALLDVGFSDEEATAEMQELSELYDMMEEIDV